EVLKGFFTPITDLEKQSSQNSSPESTPQFPCPIRGCEEKTEVIWEDGRSVRVRCPVHKIETYYAKEKKERGPSQVIRPEWSLDVKKANERK
ncbi:MAG: hypothetical protein AAB875_06995, partial [Patescibacteria group bacterium]